MQTPITTGHKSLLVITAYPRGKWGPEVGAFPTSMAHTSFEELTVLEAGLFKALGSTAPTLGPGASSSHPPSEATPRLAPFSLCGFLLNEAFFQLAAQPWLCQE